MHKHRIGSCKGRLVATPQGLRYDTDDKDDRFSASLDDLELFEVDYLAKVLKVKLKKGSNTILLKINNGDGAHGFYFTILAEQELKLAGKR